MRVLVTGSKGFVAQWLIAHFEAEGDQVVGLDAEVDVTDSPMLAKTVTSAGAEAICHLAAQASVGASWQDPAHTYAVNTLGTLNLLEAAYASTPRPRVLLVSSAEVYGLVSGGDLPIAEDHPFAPVSPYAASKAAAELIGLQSFLGRGLDVLRVRPFNHTGPGQRPDFVVPALARQISAAAAAGATQIATGNLDARRDMTDVRDVVRAYRSVLLSGAPGQVYNVCRGESISIREIARRLMRLAGVELDFQIDPARFRPIDQPDLLGDPTRVKAATGWEPVIPFDETLADVLSYWQAQDR